MTLPYQYVHSALACIRHNTKGVTGQQGSFEETKESGGTEESTHIYLGNNGRSGHFDKTNFLANVSN